MTSATSVPSASFDCYTMGYEGLGIGEFIDRLSAVSVEQVLDVRERAQSRKPGFSGRPLKAGLREEGIEYRHIPELGSPSAVRAEYRRTGDFETFRLDYERYLKSRELFLVLLSELIALRKTALLCFERDSDTCHRSLISRKLEPRGISFSHL
jgi:uncharacterized protein (DUF488 family)